MQVRPFRTASLTLALALAGLAAPSARALDIVFRDVGTTQMSSAQFSAFEEAASFWESKLFDNVTVYINISFDNLGGNTLGDAFSSAFVASYGSVRSRLQADITSAADVQAVGHLQAGSSLSFMATQPNQATYLDNNDTFNNAWLSMTTANAKALGYTDVGTDATSPDARIRFSNSFANSFAYSRVNGGVPGDKIDFITIAEHEIGHALGFTSGVDEIAYCLSAPAECGSPSSFDDRVSYSVLDLYRYSAADMMDVTVGGTTYFSLDGGTTALQTFSGGQLNGSGSQASHFGGGTGTLMQPGFSDGQTVFATETDMKAMDAIGWNLSAVNPVPEPESYALMLGGLAVLGWAGRRRAVSA